MAVMSQAAFKAAMVAAGKWPHVVREREDYARELVKGGMPKINAKRQAWAFVIGKHGGDNLTPEQVIAGEGASARAMRRTVAKRAKAHLEAEMDPAGDAPVEFGQCNDLQAIRWVADHLFATVEKKNAPSATAWSMWKAYHGDQYAAAKFFEQVFAKTVGKAQDDGVSKFVNVQEDRLLAMHAARHAAAQPAVTP